MDGVLLAPTMPSRRLKLTIYHGPSGVFDFAPRPHYCRLAKKAKKERQGKGTGTGGGATAKGGTAAKSKKGPKPKMTKEERRAKYTQK